MGLRPGHDPPDPRGGAVFANDLVEALIEVVEPVVVELGGEDLLLMHVEVKRMSELARCLVGCEAKVPELGITLTSFSACNWRMASRNGVREIPSRSQISFSLIDAPGRSSS